MRQPSESRSQVLKCEEVAAEKHIDSHDSGLVSQLRREKKIIKGKKKKRLFSILSFTSSSVALVMSIPSPRRFVLLFIMALGV